MPTAEMKIDLLGIASVLKQSRLRVPVHQRPFEWTQDEVDELLDDVAAGLEANEQYFLGSVVVISTPDSSGNDLLDGQQRLATVALLLVGIADHFTALGDDKRSQTIKTQFLWSFDMVAGEDRPQLRLSDADDGYFRRLLNDRLDAPGSGSPDSHKRLQDARSRTYRWLESKVAGSPDPSTWLTRLYGYLVDQAKVILLVVPDDSNAFLIFETLNDRGLDLSIADLVKNYLLGRAGEDLNVVLTNWNSTLLTLRSYGGEELFIDFLRQYWSSRYSLTREKHLYRRIKGALSTRTDVIKFAEDLSANGALYAAIMSDDHEYWTDTAVGTRERIRTLSVLGLVQYRPMLLAAMDKLPLAEVEKIVRLLVDWNSRILIVGGSGGGEIERMYSELGQKIRKGELKSAADVSTAGRDKIPSDRAFREAFATATVSKIPLARYYLRELERTRRGEAGSELTPNIDPTKLTLEHIFPEKPGSNWPQFSDDESKAYLKRLGNLALLQQRLNSPLRSAPFEKKRDTYKASEIQLTRELADLPNWDTSAVEARQGLLADLAVKTWKAQV